MRRTALDFMGQLNPAIKAPMEQLFDTQFHTQRRLSDLQAPQTASAIGRLFGEENPQLLSQILVNTPATRFITATFFRKSTCRLCRAPEPALHRPKQALFFLGHPVGRTSCPRCVIW